MRPGLARSLRVRRRLDTPPLLPLLPPRHPSASPSLHRFLCPLPRQTPIVRPSDRRQRHCSGAIRGPLHDRDRASRRRGVNERAGSPAISTPDASGASSDRRLLAAGCCHSGKPRGPSLKGSAQTKNRSRDWLHLGIYSTATHRSVYSRVSCPCESTRRSDLAVACCQKYAAATQYTSDTLVDTTRPRHPRHANHGIISRAPAAEA